MIAKCYHLYQKRGTKFYIYTYLLIYIYTHTDLYSSEKVTKILVTVSWEVN